MRFYEGHFYFTEKGYVLQCLIIVFDCALIRFLSVHFRVYQKSKVHSCFLVVYLNSLSTFALTALKCTVKIADGESKGLVVKVPVLEAEEPHKPW